MHDILFIRNKPQEFDKAMALRGVAVNSDSILQLDKVVRSLKEELESIISKRKDVANGILFARQSKDDESLSFLSKEDEIFKKKITSLKSELVDKESELYSILSTIPNILFDDVPAGLSERDNVVIKEWGDKPVFDFAPLQHFELGAKLGQMDFEISASISGSRFVILAHQLARLERALWNFMLDINTKEFGYTEVSPPLLVRPKAVFGTGQLPKFEHDLFSVSDGEYRLIPTSEVPLVNLIADRVIEESALPIRVTACTPCFRSEAGSAGKDTRGMIRLHQFNKVELVSITVPELSEAEHERMVSIAETILMRLSLPYRRVLLCSRDTGFSSAKTYDLEVWFPGQNAYREISSCSNCSTFQSVRMNARYKPNVTLDKNFGKRKLGFPHTLNGSALALGRCLAAILENYQQCDGTIMVPIALRDYMDGCTTINLGSDSIFCSSLLIEIYQI